MRGRRKSKKKRPQEHKDLNNINPKRSLTEIEVVYPCGFMLKKFLNFKYNLYNFLIYFFK